MIGSPRPRPFIAMTLLAGAWAAGYAPALAADTADPRLVTFGPLALVNEGDHDFRQVIRISVPEGAGRLHVRLFDPDTGGGFDEPKGGFDTETRFSLYGEGVAARIFRDERGEQKGDGAELWLHDGIRRAGAPLTLTQGR